MGGLSAGIRPAYDHLQSLRALGGARRARHVGRWKIGQHALLVGTAYNLLRLARLALRGASPAAAA